MNTLAENKRHVSNFSRDKLGRITQKVETVAGLSETSDYTYDLAGRLDTVTIDGALIADYAYDSNSNRVGVVQQRSPDEAKRNPGLTPAQAISGIPTTSCAANLPNVAATVDAQDRLLTYGTCTYQYTDNGELSHKTDTATSAVTTYQYDSFSNLRHVSLPDGRAIDYQIDGRNRRIGKSINGVAVQGLIYINDLEPVAETDPDGNRIATFIYADRANTPSYLLKGGNVYRVIADHLGSVRLVINVADGSIAQRLDYDAWGQVLLDTNPGFQPFGFAGGIYDRDTGLVRFGARDYDSEVGRWTNKDPIGFGGGDVNIYSYLGNEPIRYIDPFGLSKFDKLFGLPKQFWNWYHRKQKGPGDADLSKDEARALHEEWKDLGKPGPDNKGKQGGYVDFQLLEWLIPWPLIPSEMGCSDLDCNRNGVPDYQEDGQCK